MTNTYTRHHCSPIQIKVKQKFSSSFLRQELKLHNSALLSKWNAFAKLTCPQWCYLGVTWSKSQAGTCWYSKSYRSTDKTDWQTRKNMLPIIALGGIQILDLKHFQAVLILNPVWKCVVSTICNQSFFEWKSFFLIMCDAKSNYTLTTGTCSGLNTEHSAL